MSVTVIAQHLARLVGEERQLERHARDIRLEILDGRSQE
jgi:hypothetical protein